MFFLKKPSLVIITVIVELTHGTGQEFVIIITVIVELTHGQVRNMLLLLLL